MKKIFNKVLIHYMITVKLIKRYFKEHFRKDKIKYEYNFKKFSKLLPKEMSEEDKNKYYEYFQLGYEQGFSEALLLDEVIYEQERE